MCIWEAAIAHAIPLSKHIIFPGGGGIRVVEDVVERPDIRGTHQGLHPDLTVGEVQLHHCLMPRRHLLGAEGAYPHRDLQIQKCVTNTQGTGGEGYCLQLRGGIERNQNVTTIGNLPQGEMRRYKYGGVAEKSKEKGVNKQDNEKIK